MTISSSTHEAEALRAPIDLHFSEPHRHGFDTHFVWNYWYVPGLYTYLRARRKA